MSKNQKLLTGFVIGATAGAAAVLFFKTEKGKQLLSDLKNAADEIFNNFKETSSTVKDMVTDLLEEEDADEEDFKNNAATPA